jgi:hypothetical protein
MIAIVAQASFYLTILFCTTGAKAIGKPPRNVLAGK